MAMVNEPGRQTPVVAETDVLVVGGDGGRLAGRSAANDCDIEDFHDNAQRSTLNAQRSTGRKRELERWALNPSSELNPHWRAMY